MRCNLCNVTFSIAATSCNVLCRQSHVMIVAVAATVTLVAMAKASVVANVVAVPGNMS